MLLYYDLHTQCFVFLISKSLRDPLPYEKGGWTVPLGVPAYAKIPRKLAEDVASVLSESGLNAEVLGPSRREDPEQFIQRLSKDGAVQKRLRAFVRKWNNALKQAKTEAEKWLSQQRKPSRNPEALRRGAKCEEFLGAKLTALKEQVREPRSIEFDKAEDWGKALVRQEGVPLLERKEDFPETFWNEVGTTEDMEHLDKARAWVVQDGLPPIRPAGFKFKSDEEYMLVVLTLAKKWWEEWRMAEAEKRRILPGAPVKKSPKRYGRPPHPNPGGDRKLYDRWLSYRESTVRPLIAEFANELGKDSHEVRESLERERKRHWRARLAAISPENPTD